jgi:hypothetical protein
VIRVYNLGDRPPPQSKLRELWGDFKTSIWLRQVTRGIELRKVAALVRQLRDGRDLDDVGEAIDALCSWLDEYEKKR